MIDDHSVVLIHVAEIFLKSPYVKRYFQKVLLSRITTKLNRWEVTYKILGWKHNICTIAGQFSDKVLSDMANTFGISYIAPALITETNFASIRSALYDIRSSWKGEKPASYRITAHKDKKMSLSHYSIEYEASFYFEDWKVDLKNPEINIEIDLKSDRTALYYKKIAGPGGLPYGTQGKVLVLASNGIDSPVAAYMIAKRGCEIILLHFGESPLLNLQKGLEFYTGKSVKMITLPHIPLLNLYKENFIEKYRCIYCKLSMIAIANKVAKAMHAKAIVTGENLGQVASQTLDNLALTHNNSNLPLLRPLIGMDKQEIISFSKKIRFYRFFQNIACAYVPTFPSTTMKQIIFEKWIKQIQFDEIIEKYWQEYWQKDDNCSK